MKLLYRHIARRHVHQIGNTSHVFGQSRDCQTLAAVRFTGKVGKRNK